MRTSVPTGHVERLEEDTMRVALDIIPEGQQKHPHCRVQYSSKTIPQDSGLRLGIKLFGIYKTTDLRDSSITGEYWLTINPEHSIEKANSLVDWM
jgi:hypothetical protein